MTKEKNCTIEEHRHRFACWVASRAASVRGKSAFEVKEGVKIINECGFPKYADQLLEIKDFDLWHEELCKKVIKKRNAQIEECKKKDPSYNRQVSYGVAAKLINCYLKARFVCGGADEDKIKAIHPPIDSLLLESLVKNNKQFREFYKKELKSKAWSNFNKTDYTKVIGKIKSLLGQSEPLWKIEYHWQGFRD